jgi:putative flippase GtrA
MTMPEPAGAPADTVPAVAAAPAVTTPRPFFQRIWVLFRSCLVGLLATASDLGSLMLLIHGAGWSKRAANIPSLLPGLLVQFVGNKYFAFEDRSKAIVKQGSLFLLIEAAAFGLNVLLFDLLVTLTPIHEIGARLLGTNIVYLGFSFPLWSIFVFRRGRVAARRALEVNSSKPAF